MPKRIYLPDKICSCCGKSFNRYRSPSGRLEGLEDYRIRKFCDHKCSESWHIGKNHPLYKPEGSVRPDGYVRIAVNGKREYLHRHLMKEYLGRPLQTEEHVHHDNENPEDNRIENLVLTNNSEHLKHHYRQRKINDKGQFIKCKRK